MEKGEKRERVLEYLRQGILSGKWTGTVLPAEVTLARQFGYSRETVRKAYAKLVEEGFLERRKHRGTVLCGSYQEKHVIGAVMRCHDHFFGDIFHCLKKLAAESGYLVQAVDTFGYEVPRLRKPIRRQISGIVHAPITNLILGGSLCQSLPLFKELLRKRPVFFDFIDWKWTEDLTGVLIDYYVAGRMGAEYLLKQGSRKPLLFLGPLWLKLRYNPDIFSRHKDKLLLDGFSDVLKEAGMDPMHHFIFPDSNWKDIERQLFEIFSDPDCRPDGFFACQDVKLVRMLKVAAECGYVPKYQIGMLNTPWSRGEAGYTFSTIEIPPEKCAEALLQQVLLPPEQRTDVYIKPRLIERQAKKYESKNANHKGGTDSWK